MSEARKCPHCDKPLAQRPRERNTAFARRRYCGRACALRDVRLSPASISARHELCLAIDQAARAVASNAGAAKTEQFKDVVSHARRSLNRGGGYWACSHWIEAVRSFIA